MTPASKTRAPISASLRPRARFFGPTPESYRRLNRELLAHGSEPISGPALPDAESFRAAASTVDLDREVKILPLPTPIPGEVCTAAVRAMERLHDRGVLTPLRGNRATDLPRPEAGRLAETVRSEAPELIQLIERIERVLDKGPLFVRALKLDQARVSTTAAPSDPTATNLHFDAERSSLSDYPEPVFQFYLNAGRLDRQFRILPVRRDTILAVVAEPERRTLPLEAILRRFLDSHSPVLETIPVESGVLAIFDGRQFAHDAGKGDTDALAGGRFEPSPEPDLVIALDTVETSYHHGLYRPETPFFEDRGF